MSSTEQLNDEVCANCGKAEVDEIKLQKCTCCDLVKYCSDGCRELHRPEHIGACKKRAAEIRDDKLLSQPDGNHLGECPICFLPLPLDEDKQTMNSCCCKRICEGCNFANKKREIEQGLEQKCPYCRELLPETQEEIERNLMKRAKANDPLAIFQMGAKRYNEGDYEGAFEYYTKAAALGDPESHFFLSIMYGEGEGVRKNLKKKVYHLEEATIGGHPIARHNLACYEAKNGSEDRAVKHFVIAAKLGFDEALEMVKENFRLEFVSKEDYAAALRGHQAAVDATKSKQREEAYTFIKRHGLEYI
jgi:tetratricopeptide (TPR) repeat protein